ncbi:MAG: hypothetical protein II388_03370 [Clostridia bacterium]|nr:hypothetical protein [Clostridia bacterium]
MSTTKFAGITALTEFLSKCDDRYARAGNIPGVDSYTITKLATATNGYAATYQLNKNGAAIVGSVIDIPKDYLVKSAELKSCTTANTPVQGYAVGDKYIDFVVNTTDNSGTTSHIYLLVSDLVDAYTAGNGINITSQNVVSVKLGTANGLSLDNNGLSLSTATTSAAGAMSAADKTTLNKAYTTDNLVEITTAEVDALFV